jgi:hypothetical protein
LPNTAAKTSVLVRKKHDFLSARGDIKERKLDPFFTIRPIGQGQGQGRGLGLSMI